MRAVRWVALPFALWLLVAPWLLDYQTAATVSSVAVGVVTLAMTAPEKGDPSRFGGGWRSLWSDAAPSQGAGS